MEFFKSEGNFSDGSVRLEIQSFGYIDSDTNEVGDILSIQRKGSFSSEISLRLQTGLNISPERSSENPSLYFRNRTTYFLTQVSMFFRKLH